MVKDNGTIVRRCSMKATTLRVVATDYGDNHSVWSAVDTIRNETTKEDVKNTRRKWYKLFLNKNWIEIKEQTNEEQGDKSKLDTKNENADNE